MENNQLATKDFRSSKIHTPDKHSPSQLVDVLLRGFFSRNSSLGGAGFNVITDGRDSGILFKTLQIMK